MTLSPAAYARTKTEDIWASHEVDLGDEPLREGSFIITDSRINANSIVSVIQAVGPYTGKGTRADESIMDQIWCMASPGSQQATVYWRALEGARVKGNVKFSYRVSGPVDVVVPAVVQIQVLDNLATPVASATVTVRQALDSTLITTGITDFAGRVSVQVPDGVTYNVTAESGGQSGSIGPFTADAEVTGSLTIVVS